MTRTKELINFLNQEKGFLRGSEILEDMADEIIQKLRELDDIKQILRDTMHAMGECCSVYDFVTGSYLE